MEDSKHGIPEEHVSEKGGEISPGGSDIAIGDFVHLHPTPEQEARVLRKIDR